MSDINILLDEQNQLNFDVEVQGVSAKTVQPRFIIESDGIDYSFDGKFDGKSVSVELPILANVLETDQYKCRLEFIVEGEKFFQPMEATLDAVLPVKVRAGIKGNKKVIQDKSKVVISGVKHNPAPETSEPINKVDVSKDEVETKDFSLEFKDVKEDGTFVGYGAMFGNVDSHNDIIKKGAFTKTLNERKNIKMLWQHDPKQPIGVFTKLFEDSDGLRVEGKLAMDVQKGKEAFTLMKMGAIEGLSIGYRTIKASYDRKNDIRNLEELKLLEVSVVTFPSNDSATVTSMKSESKDSEQTVEGLLELLNAKNEPNDIHLKEPVVDHSVEPKETHSDVDDEIKQLLHDYNTERS